MGFTAINHLGEALGRHLGIDRLPDLGVQDLIGLATYSGHAIYLLDPCIGVIFRKISSWHIVRSHILCAGLHAKHQAKANKNRDTVHSSSPCRTLPVRNCYSLRERHASYQTEITKRIAQSA